MPDWILAMDHKPLIPIMGTKELDLIPNPRILNQHVKLLQFSYTPVHVPKVFSHKAMVGATRQKYLQLPEVCIQTAEHALSVTSLY